MGTSGMEMESGMLGIFCVHCWKYDAWSPAKMPMCCMPVESDVANTWYILMRSQWVSSFASWVEAAVVYRWLRCDLADCSGNRRILCGVIVSTCSLWCTTLSLLRLSKEYHWQTIVKLKVSLELRWCGVIVPICWDWRETVLVTAFYEKWNQSLTRSCSFYIILILSMQLCDFCQWFLLSILLLII